ncbi:MAG TPA: hypothetical protein VJP06_06165 [Thermoplasmata archaeon]|nr:hypothetical protein [Thermoplasmata archaeon]
MKFEDCMGASRRIGLVVVLLLGIMAAFGFAGVPVAAHTHRTVGEYEFIVGWRLEPASTGVLNGLDMGIERHFANNTTAWVEGVEGALTTVLSTGGVSVTKAVTPQEGRPGWYTFDVIPTRVGTYSVRITGTLNTTSVNISVDLDDVAAASDIQFPVPDPTPSDLQDRLNQANTQIAGLQSQVGLALAVGIAGLLAAIVVGAGSILMARKRKTP